MIQTLREMLAEAEREAPIQIVGSDWLLLLAKRDALREALKRAEGGRPDRLWARRHPLGTYGHHV
jgi:hypothetical protein